MHPQTGRTDEDWHRYRMHLSSDTCVSACIVSSSSVPIPRNSALLCLLSKNPSRSPPSLPLLSSVPRCHFNPPWPRAKRFSHLEHPQTPSLSRIVSSSQKLTRQSTVKTAIMTAQPARSNTQKASRSMKRRSSMATSMAGRRTCSLPLARRTG